MRGIKIKIVRRKDIFMLRMFHWDRETVKNAEKTKIYNQPFMEIS